MRRLLKRGAVESYFLISILVAVIGFVIVLYFLYQADFIGQSEDEICKLSVLARATSPDVAQSGVPLKCNTKKFCLTRNGDCRNNFAGEKPEVVKLSSDDSEAISKIEKVSADVMYDCWKAMGEGKLDLFGRLKEQFGWEQGKPTCVICSRIAIDESFPSKGSGKKLDDININNYMRDNIIPELGVNYISAFTGGGAVSYAKEDPVKKNAFDQFAAKNVLTLNGNSGNEPNRELAIVFMQFRPPSVGSVLDNMLKWGGTVAGATFLSPIGLGARSIVANPVGGSLAVAGAAGLVGYGMYNAYQGQLAAAGYCGKFVTNENKVTEGCSMVQGINYNYRDINAICPNIQGNL